MDMESRLLDRNIRNYNRLRKVIRCVAIIDLILTSLALWVPIVLLFVDLVSTAEKDIADADAHADVHILSTSTSTPPVAVPASTIHFYTLTLILIMMMIFLQMLAGIRLINATRLDPKVAVQYSRFWCLITLFLVTCLIIGLLMKDPRGVTAVTVVVLFAIRLLPVCIVLRFIIIASKLSGIGDGPTTNSSQEPIAVITGSSGSSSNCSTIEEYVYTFIPMPTDVKNDTIINRRNSHPLDVVAVPMVIKDGSEAGASCLLNQYDYVTDQ